MFSKSQLSLVHLLQSRADRVKARMEGRLENVSINYGKMTTHGFEPILSKLKDAHYLRSLLSLRNEVGVDILVSDAADRPTDSYTKRSVMGNPQHTSRVNYLTDEKSNTVRISGRSRTQIRKFYIERYRVIIIGERNFYAEITDDDEVIFRPYDIADKNSKVGPIILDSMYQMEKSLPKFKQTLDVFF